MGEPRPPAPPAGRPQYAPAPITADDLLDPLEARLKHIEAQVDWIKNYLDPHVPTVARKIVDVVNDAREDALQRQLSAMEAMRQNAAAADSRGQELSGLLRALRNDLGPIVDGINRILRGVESILP